LSVTWSALLAIAMKHNNIAKKALLRMVVHLTSSFDLTQSGWAFWAREACFLLRTFSAKSIKLTGTIF
jgi:hypothetical protein